MAKARPEIDGGIIKCPICFEVFTKPKSLPCLHTFCLECLSAYITKCTSGDEVQSSGFPCPICRATTIPPKTTENPASWAEQFPTNGMILHVLEISNFRKKDKYCEPCQERTKENKKSEKWCKNCTAYLCKECLEFHNSLLKGHNLVPADSAVANAADVIENRVTICEEHEEKMDLFCSDHQQMACAKCIAIDHRRCDKVVTTKAFARELQTTGEINTIEKELENRLVEISHISDKNDKKLRNLENNKEELRNEISKLTTEMVEFFKKVEEKSQNNLAHMYKEDGNKIKKEIKECEIFKQSAEYSRKMMQTAEICGGSDQIVSTHLKAKSENEALKKKLSQMEESANEEKLYKLSDDMPFSKLKKDALFFEEGIKLNRASADIDMTKCVPVQLSSFKATVESDSTKCRLTGVLVTENKKIILCDVENKKIKLFDMGGKLMSELITDGLRTFDLCFMENKVIVSLTPKGTRKVAVLDFNGHTLCLASYITTEYTCTGITFGDGKIFVSCPWADTPCLCMFNSIGATSRVIEKCNEHPVPGSVWHLAVSEKTKEIIGSHINGKDSKLLFFNYNGDGKRQLRIPDLSGSRGIDVDFQGNIYVCGIESSNIVQLSPDGLSSRILLSKEHGLVKPAAISFFGTTFAVTEDEGPNNDVVKVYEMRLP